MAHCRLRAMMSQNKTRKNIFRLMIMKFYLVTTEDVALSDIRLFRKHEEDDNCQTQLIQIKIMSTQNMHLLMGQVTVSTEPHKTEQHPPLLMEVLFNFACLCVQTKTSVTVCTTTVTRTAQYFDQWIYGDSVQT